MAHYDKKVIYLSEMEYGNKRKGAGFVRMECRGESCSFDMHVSGMDTLAERKYDVTVISVQGKEYRVGKIFIHNGHGDWNGVYEKGRVEAAVMGGEESEEIPCQEIAEILVKISDTKTLMGKTPFAKNVIQAAEIAEEGNTERGGQGVRDGRRAGEEAGTGAGVKDDRTKRERTGAGEEVRGGMAEEEKAGTGDTMRSGRKAGTGAETGQGTEDPEEGRGIWKFVRGGTGWADNGRKGDRQENDFDGKRGNGEATKRENRIQKDSGRNRKEMAGEEGKIQIDDVILNDKWDQLKQLYSVVHPYEDDRQYIAIQPKDFVIMTGDYQHLANNSFLLHGFYNYRHIVLGRERDGCFYLGVPGVYYEREKMVALMFGFEAFECEGGKAEAGKFGYYLRKVKI